MKHPVVAVLSLLAASAAADEARLLRFADIHGERVAFVYAGDIYAAPAGGGDAVRLTSHVGLELFPKFSPDGEQIAFSAEYSGSRQVYVMPAEGGPPRQLTWYNDVGQMPPRGGWDYWVLDWTPDGNNVLVRANRLPWGPRMGRPYLVPVDGGLERPLAVPEGGGGMLSPDGTKLVYTPIDREFRTWKRHRGGRAQDVWVYDLAADTAERLTTHPGTDHQPLWVGEDIYFTSDRDFTLNLYRHVPGGEPVRVTDHDDFDVLWASAGPNAIVYEAGGHLYRYDPATGAARRIPITIRGDWPDARAGFKAVGGNIESMDLSPHGERALFGARGEIFTVPAKNGEPRNLSRTSDAREIRVSWSPDGRWIAYLSDLTGEYEIYLRAQDGSGEPRRLTDNGGVWRFAPVFSPDSRKLAFADKTQRLFILDLDGGRTREVDRSRHNELTEFAWSPDSAWLAYTKNDEAGIGSIWVYSLGAGSTRQLTSAWARDFNPVFDPKGRYLYFLSNRDYNLTFSDYEANYVYTDATRVYAGILAADGPALFRPKSDEAAPIEEAANKDRDKNGESAPAKVTVRIDFDGFDDRVQALMTNGADYAQLAASEAGVYYLAPANEAQTLKRFNVADEAEEVILEGIRDYRLSAAGDKVLFRAGDGYGIAAAQPKQDAKEGRLDLTRLELRIDPRREWAQMYTDAWRILRDWFYDPGMHGQDWVSIRERYQPLVEHVRHRADLDYIFGELAGEMNAGHIYVQAGDQPSVQRRDGGLLGAEIVPDASGYPRIERIFPGRNWHPDFRSPLTEPGVDVRPGDLILAVNGVDARRAPNFYALLENTANRVVTLSVNDRARVEGARVVQVKPVASETNLRYLEWAESRRALTERLSGGRIGYIHLPDTAVPGNRELALNFPPQVHKDALIIDDRYNGGGFIPDRMIELLARKRLNYWKQRGLDPQATPALSHDGPKAMLINSYSSSGGDALPYYFRKLGLGPLIGTRTWGGLIGISGNPDLADGGSILASTFRFLTTDGRWAVENEGVAPDIEVIDSPDLVAKGRDPSLERAVEYLLAELENQPPGKVATPPAPTDFGR